MWRTDRTISEQTVCRIFLKSGVEVPYKKFVSFFKKRLCGSVLCICPSNRLELGCGQTRRNVAVRCGFLDRLEFGCGETRRNVAVRCGFLDHVNS